MINIFKQVDEFKVKINEIEQKKIADFLNSVVFDETNFE